MNWRFWRSPRDRVMGDIRKEMKEMRETISGEYEDAGLMELMDEMDSLRRSFDRILEPERPTQTTGPAPVIPPELVDGLLELVPEGYRGIAGLAARRILNDPKRLEGLIAKIRPIAEKAQGQLPAQQGVTPSSGNVGVLQQAGIPPEYYEGYDPAHPPTRKWGLTTPPK